MIRLLEHASFVPEAQRILAGGEAIARTTGTVVKEFPSPGRGDRRTTVSRPFRAGGAVVDGSRGYALCASPLANFPCPSGTKSQRPNTPQRWKTLSHGLLWLGLLIALNLAVTADPSIVTIRTPHQGRVPEVALDKKGVLHLMYGKDQNGFYVQSRDGGKTFSAPVQVNQRVGTITIGAERGVKIAVGKDGTIHAVWLGHYQKGGGIWYTRSTDGGKTFAPERNVQDTNVGSDSPAIVADASGNVLVFWLDARIDKEADNPVAHPILLARSTDNGVTFGRNEIVKYDFAGRACACCRLEARLHGDEVYIAFRTGYHNLRDFYLLKGRKTENNFHATRISEDHWKLEGCPMSGADFRVDKNGQVVVSWMSQGKVYWSKTTATGFAPRIHAPASEGTANHPVIVTKGKDVLLLWKQSGNLNWARYTMDGKFSGEQGIVAPLPGKDKATAFVGAEGKIYVAVSE